RLPGDMTVDKRDPLVEKVKTMVDAEYAAGRNTAMGDIELDDMVRRADADAHLAFEHHTVASRLLKKNS
ncbi:MAG: hypothetical protein J6X30_01615, partial [Clostridia bacterium]|nr:hypothetical protein [Clostridia bacterium]